MTDLTASESVAGDDKLARRVCLGFTITGAVAFCVYSRSWKDWYHLVYDVPPAIAVFSFLGRLLYDGLTGARTVSFWIRLVFVVPLAVIPVGRDFFRWNISGHLTDVLAIAVLQSFDRRLSIPVRVAYWLPLLVVVPIRWLVFDEGNHWQTYNAIIIAGVCAGLAVFAVKVLEGRRSAQRA